MVTQLEQKLSNIKNKINQDSNIYGSGYTQAEMINATKLHQINLNGSGVTIAIIDAGYSNANKHVVFKHALKHLIKISANLTLLCKVPVSISEYSLSSTSN